MSSKQKIYLDNAATTPLDSAVIEVMSELMSKVYGNPSSVHALGRNARVVIENSRKKIATLIHAAPAEIIFTSCGTEANNMALRGAVASLNITKIISSPIEHHSVLETVEELKKNNKITVDYVDLDEFGNVDVTSLEKLLVESEEDTILVSLMHANNEIGNMLPIENIAELCKKHNAFFHSDTVQSMGFYEFDVRKFEPDFITCSAHKFHGPKGVGFLFINQKNRIKPLLTGGSQERNMRAGTENIHGIAGMAKAFELAHENMDKNNKHINDLKRYFMEQIERIVPEIQYNGNPKGNSLDKLLNISFPNSDMDEMLLYNFDIDGVCVSGGSACSSGSNMASHVLKVLQTDMNKPAIRFSFSRNNTKQELDYTLDLIKNWYCSNKSVKL